MKHLALVLLVALFSSVATAGPPDYSGVVSRGTTPIASYFVDEDAGLLATLGVDPVEFCSGSGDLDFIAWQDMSMSSGLRWATIGKGNNVRASVYKSSDFAGFTVPEICEAVLSGVALPLATGEVNYRMQDNDFAGGDNCESKENFNSAGHSFAGPLYSPYGRKMQFSGRDRLVWDCDNYRVVHYDVKLSLVR
jgi:hypothetical protein